MAAGVFQLLGLGQAWRIEYAAPRLVGPAADADADGAASCAGAKLWIKAAPPADAAGRTDQSAPR